MNNYLENQNVRLVGVFIVGVIVGVIACVIVNRANTKSADLAPLDTYSATSTESVIQGDNGIIVQNQSAGSKVEVEQVVLSKPGWVAIHDDVNGQPGRILGAHLFDAGKSSGTVELLRNTVNGTSYFAVVHTDDGDYKNFNAKTDTLLKDNSGAYVMVKFTAGETTSASTTEPVSPLINIEGK